MDKLKLAVIGCGAQAEGSHLPAAALSGEIELIALVDKILPQARRLAEKYGVPIAASDYNEIIGKADAALVVLPNYLHAPVAVDLLRQGVHVLVEKPMAITSDACQEMIAAADIAKVHLAVGFDFRFLKASQFVHQAIKSGLVGRITSFDLRLGNILPSSYILKSDYLIRKEAAGGGVLIDLGVHALDLVLWWLGDYESVTYFDDSHGGVEANSMLRLHLKSGAEGTIEISRLRKLRNTCIIEGERGILEVGLWTSNGLLDLRLHDQDVVLKGENLAANETWHDVFCRQLDDFADAVRTHREPLVPGREGKRSVDLVGTCYGSRQSLPEPWMFPVSQTVGAMEGL